MHRRLIIAIECLPHRGKLLFERCERRAERPRVVEGDRGPGIRGTPRETNHVATAGAKSIARNSCTGKDSGECGGSCLRQMARQGDEPVVCFGTDDFRERSGVRPQLLQHRQWRSGGRIGRAKVDRGTGKEPGA